MGLFGGVDHQWRDQDKLAVFAGVNMAAGIANGETYATEMSLFRAAEQAKVRGYNYFCAVSDLNEQIAMEMRGELPIPAKKGMKPKPNQPGFSSSTVYIMSTDAFDKCSGATYVVDDTLRSYSEKFKR